MSTPFIKETFGNEATVVVRRGALPEWADGMKETDTAVSAIVTASRLPVCDMR